MANLSFLWPFVANLVKDLVTPLSYIYIYLSAMWDDMDELILEITSLK